MQNLMPLSLRMWPPPPSSPLPGSHSQVPRSLCKHAQWFPPPPLPLGSRLQAPQSLHKQTRLHIPPPALPGSHLRAPQPCFCKHLLSTVPCPHLSLPHPHNFPVNYITR